MKEFVSQKWQSFKNSKFFLFVIALTIGITYTYCYMSWKYEIRHIFEVSPVVVHSVLQVDEVQASSISGRMDERVDDIVPLSATEELIAEAFGDQAKVMLAIAKAESGLRADAINKNSNGTTDIGIFQINSIHGYDSQKLRNIEFNIQCAKEILDKQGLTAWSVYNNKKYLEFF